MSFKSQSAMEYLMTYGWAILIIAIVMVALFQLGVFNGTFFAPRATAGACEVYRSVEGINLVGQCQGELPQFVASIKNPTGSTRVVPTSYISMPNPVGFSNQFTASVWVNIMAIGSGSDNKQPIFSMDCGQIFEMNYNSSGNNNFDFFSTNNGVTSGSFKTSFGTWYSLAGTYNSGIITFYVNGVQVNQTTSTGILTPSGGLNISNEAGCAGALVVLVSNAQIYNTSLSANEISALYIEGIGGAPVDPTHIVGWWPLNGNAQDYSGNNNGGVPTNVVYTSSWTSGYKQP